MRAVSQVDGEMGDSDGQARPGGADLLGGPSEHYAGYRADGGAKHAGNASETPMATVPPATAPAIPKSPKRTNPECRGTAACRSKRHRFR